MNNLLSRARLFHIVIATAVFWWVVTTVVMVMLD